MSNWVSIDPGLDCVGWAVWDGQDLINAGVSRRTGKAQGPAVWKAHAKFVAEKVDGMYLDLIVTEMPRVYPRSPVNPAGLIQVAAVAGAICSALNAPVGITYLPADWKGKRKKEQTTPEILLALSKTEVDVVVGVTAPKSLLHNMFDAVGIGLWHSGRIQWQASEKPSPRSKKPRGRRTSKGTKKRRGATRKSGKTF